MPGEVSFLRSQPPWFLREVLSLNLELSNNVLGLLASNPQGFSFLCAPPPELGLRNAPQFWSLCSSDKKFANRVISQPLTLTLGLCFITRIFPLTFRSKYLLGVSVSHRHNKHTGCTDGFVNLLFTHIHAEICARIHRERQRETDRQSTFLLQVYQSTVLQPCPCSNGTGTALSSSFYLAGSGIPFLLPQFGTHRFSF